MNLLQQFNHCQRIIQIPIPQFMKLMEDNAEASPTSDVNLILLSNTGRCGSTLLTQLFEKQVRLKANHKSMSSMYKMSKVMVYNTG